MDEPDPPGGIPADKLIGDVGAPDVGMMRTIRELFLREEPLVESASFDTALSPRELHVTFADAVWCRLDVTWHVSNAYRFHYVDESGVNWRFDRHPNDHSPEKHFHEPPAAESETAVRSCIAVEEPGLVARAVLRLWRRAYETGTVENVNTARNPP